jgi:hypothetical protein
MSFVRRGKLERGMLGTTARKKQAIVPAGASLFCHRACRKSELAFADDLASQARKGTTAVRMYLFATVLDDSTGHVHGPSPVLFLLQRRD